MSWNTHLKGPTESTYHSDNDSESFSKTAGIATPVSHAVSTSCSPQSFGASAIASSIYNVSPPTYSCPVTPKINSAIPSSRKVLKEKPFILDELVSTSDIFSAIPRRDSNPYVDPPQVRLALHQPLPERSGSFSNPESPLMLPMRHRTEEEKKLPHPTFVNRIRTRLAKYNIEMLGLSFRCRLYMRGVYRDLNRAAIDEISHSLRLDVLQKELSRRSIATPSILSEEMQSYLRGELACDELISLLTVI